MSYTPAGFPPKIPNHEQLDFATWWDLLNEYWKTLPWTTRFWLSVTHLFPRLYIDWEDFEKWLDKKFLV